MRALWKCTESPIEIMQIRYILAISNFRIFFQNKNSLELLNVIFENDSPKGTFWANKKKVEFLLLSPDSRKLLTTSLNKHISKVCFVRIQSRGYCNRKLIQRIRFLWFGLRETRSYKTDESVWYNYVYKWNLFIKSLFKLLINLLH